MTREECNARFAKNLREKMKEKGYTSGRLSMDTRISQQNIYNYTRDERSPSLYNAFKIATALGMTVDDMVNR